MTNAIPRKQKNAPKKPRTASERQRNLIRLFGSTPQAFKGGSRVFSPLYWAFRRFHYWLCFYDNDAEIDVEDLLQNPFNTQPPSLDDLEKLTNFRRDWIMFLYRNFKQYCSNGRMSQSQWRQIFRLIFKGANDYEFADRIFHTIAGNHSQKSVTFEDLIFCLYDLIQSFNVHGAAQPLMENAVPSTTTAQFTFSIMEPDSRGLVDEAAFLRYVKCIVDLNTGVVNNAYGDASTFGIISHMNNSSGSGGSSGGGEGGRSSRSSSQHKDYRFNGSRSSKRDKAEAAAATPPWLEAFSKQQFKTLDTDGDGYITLADIQRLFDQRVSYESLVLRTESQITTTCNNHGITASS